MAKAPEKTFPENIAELTAAVVAQVEAEIISVDEARQILGLEPRGSETAAELRSLRAEVERLRVEKATPAPSCCGHHHCGCVHWYWPTHYYPGATYPYTYTVGSESVTLSGGTNYSRSHEAAGYGVTSLGVMSTPGAARGVTTVNYSLT